ncbi:GNAT family N-acetyltransferase [Thalassotalea mangrovi]|uniref:GNAT family N-acetyltransferase n=1 Tax=Thalassotalea mangrovi TaxID=2572245 RepID=A0A4U1B5U0_9GAMM|nr:GNAT family N-acetyltransferase [Thalassotalea mangrovi]TKB45122.1 GNAT family N-acetyltransferase [Thalassotalea mangrovi]
MTYSIETANKSDKKSIQRFYKQQSYSARFLGADVTYLVRENREIIASAIVSFQNSYPFLHALVVDKNFQGRGIAKTLLAKAKVHHPQLYCFCKNDLASFYQKKQFVIIDDASLPEELRQRYLAYGKKQQLVAMYYNNQ